MAYSLRVQLVVLTLVLSQCIIKARTNEEMVSRKDQKLSPKTKIFQIFRALRQLIKKPVKSRGTPFPPLVAKPEPHQKVAIVGAGLAGLHMAYLLKKKGFGNVVVLEKDSRVGGKVMSVKHNGYPHELGACYTSPDYVTNVYALAKELGVQHFVPLPPSTVWLDNIPVPLLYKNYVVRSIMKLTNAKTPVHAVLNLVDATYRYAKLHRSLFGKYHGELMLKPCKVVLSQLNQTMMSFLKEHNLLALVPVLVAAHTMQGYGHLDRVSAVYGMMWDTPNFLTGMIARSLDLGNGGADMFRNGFMQLTDKLAALVNVRLGVKINNIKRESNGITIKFTNHAKEHKTEKFDFLIWAADAREALKVLEQPTPMEEVFTRLTNTWFTTTLFDSTEKCRSPTPISYWLSNLIHKREHSVWARRNSKFVMTGERCNTTNGTPFHVSTVAYQMGDLSPLGTSKVNEKFQQHFHGSQRLKIVKSKTWNYFPRFSVQEMADGVLWKIAENQGEINTWFIGSSVIFESTKSVLEYNKLMIDRMML